MSLLIGNRYKYSWPEHEYSTNKCVITVPATSFVFLVVAENPHTYSVRPYDKNGFFSENTMNIPKGGEFEAKCALVTTSLEMDS
jgi:hypothetical protein